MSPQLIIHIGAGSVGFLTGVVALAARKGEGVHRLVGTVFCISMLIMAASATLLAVQLSEPGNIVGGLFVIYLVATAWMAVRRKEGEVGRFEYGAMLLGIGVALGDLVLGLLVVQSGKAPPNGPPVAAAFIFAALTALAAVGDFSVIRRGGLSGVQRIARHLWRMCFALFAATGSFYTQVVMSKLPMSVTMAAGPLLFAPIFAPLLVMVFWLIRVRIGDRFAGARAAA